MEKCCDKKIEEETNKICNEFQQDKSNLIMILNGVQEKYGYIPEESQLVISKYLDMPLAEIYGVISFYTRFTLEPKAKYNISVCLGTACYVKGANNILEAVKTKLNIKEGERTKDNMFFLDVARCVGACALAPVVSINKEVYGKANAEKISKIIDEIIEKEKGA